MRLVRKSLGIGVAVVTAALAGCAPIASTWGVGSGLQLGVSPSGSFELFNSRCSLLGTPSHGAPFMRTVSAAEAAMSRMQQVSRIQSKFQLSNLGAPNMESWKSIAGGGC